MWDRGCNFVGVPRYGIIYSLNPYDEKRNPFSYTNFPKVVDDEQIAHNELILNRYTQRVYHCLERSKTVISMYGDPWAKSTHKCRKNDLEHRGCAVSPSSQAAQLA